MHQPGAVDCRAAASTGAAAVLEAHTPGTHQGLASRLTHLPTVAFAWASVGDQTAARCLERLQGWCAETSGGSQPVRASAQHKRSQKERCMQALQGRQRDTAATASGASSERSDRAARGSSLTLAQHQGMGFCAELGGIPVSCLEQCLHAAWRRRLPCLLLGSCSWRQLLHSLPCSGQQLLADFLKPSLRADELPHVGSRAACDARQRQRRRRQRRQWAAWCGGRPACAGPCASTATECRGLKGAWGRGGAGRVVKRGELTVLQASLRKSRVCTSAASWGESVRLEADSLWEHGTSRDPGTAGSNLEQSGARIPPVWPHSPSF